MEGLLAYVAQELGLRDAEAHEDVHVRRGLRLDGELRVPGHRYLVAGTWGVARWEHVSRLSFALHLLGTEARGERCTGVLVASAVPADIKDAAQDAGIKTVIAPAELLGQVGDPREPIPLTKPKSWSVVVGLLRRDSWPNLRALADATSASRSWTQVVVSDLAHRGIVEQHRGHIALVALERLMDLVASERPLHRLQVAEVATGIGSWADLREFLAQQWSLAVARMDRPGLWACGPTAAMAYTDSMLRHDRFHAYTESPEAVKELFRDRRGGIPLVLYRADRSMGPGATTWDGIHVVRLEQTLLDMMGTGFSGRDTTRALLEVLRA